MGPWVVPLVMGGASFLGGLFKNKNQSETTRPIDPAYSGLQSMVLPMIQKRLSTNLGTSNMRNLNMAAINRDYAGAQTSLSNLLAARGLGSSPVAGSAFGKLSNQRFSEMSQMDQKLPLINDEMIHSNMMDALNAINASRGTVSTQMGGGGAAGGVSGLASMLGYLYGQGAFGNQDGTGVSTPPYNTSTAAPAYVNTSFAPGYVNLLPNYRPGVPAL